MLALRLFVDSSSPFMNISLDGRNSLTELLRLSSRSSGAFKYESWCGEAEGVEEGVSNGDDELGERRALLGCGNPGLVCSEWERGMR